MAGEMDIQKTEWVEQWMEGQAGACVNGWVGGWMSGREGGWMDEWVHGYWMT